MMKSFISTLVVAGILSCNLNLDACVTKGRGDTYTVDPSGSVDQKKPKCDVKKIHNQNKKVSRLKKGKS